MPLSPAPLLPGTSPLPTPGRRPPDRRAVRLGALGAVPTLVVALVVGQLVLPRLLFLMPGLQAQAKGGNTAATGTVFQGFLYPWTRSDARSYPNGGYASSASLGNMQFESQTFHMNAVVIPVVADMPQRSNSMLYWHATDPGDIDTLPDDDYRRAIQDARKAGLIPILELVIKQQDVNDDSDSAAYVGADWSGKPSYIQIGLQHNGQAPVGTLEATWFDNYTAFAVHYAQMSAQFHLPYFIIGDGLASVTYDTDFTSAKADPKGVVIPPGESYSCNGRRECGWRHIIHAIRSPGYATYIGAQSFNGANYQGKLIYAASWAGGPQVGDNAATASEFDHIAWWDAVDFIGVDAYFPLTQAPTLVPVSALQQAWHGQGSGLAGQGDIYSRLQGVANTFHRPVLFTAAGYASAPGAASAQPPQATQDQEEQFNDMQALLLTFSGQSWWAGVFWSADQPIAPRESQPNWSLSSAWAGNTFSSSKAAGQWLATFYHSAPLHCSC